MTRVVRTMRGLEIAGRRLIGRILSAKPGNPLLGICGCPGLHGSA